MRNCVVRIASRVEAQTQGRKNNPVGCLEEVTITVRPPGSLFCNKGACWREGITSSSHACATLCTLPDPVSQLQANFTLLDEGSGPRVEVSCQAFGSPPITYSLIGKNGHIYMQQKPTYGQPANFSFPLTETSEWLQCQAENDISVQSSPLTLVPPGERAPWFPEGQLELLGRWVGGGRAPPGRCQDLGRVSRRSHAYSGPTLGKPSPDTSASLTGQLPQGPTLMLAGSLTSIAAITSWMLGWTKWTR